MIGIFQPRTQEDFDAAGQAFGKTFPIDRELYIATDSTAIGGMVGFMELTLSGPLDVYSRNVFATGKPLDAFLNGFFVRSEYRGKGIGSSLLKLLKERGRIGLATDNSGEDTDQAAIHLYAKHGFHPFKKERNSTYWIFEGE